MRKTFLIIFLTLFLAPFLAQAQGLVPCGNPGQSPCQFCHLFVLFKNIVDFFLFKIVPPLATLMIAIGGFMYIFAYFSPGQVLPGGGKGGPALLSQAKKIITSVIFGLLIIFAAWIFVNTFFMLIGVEDWTGLKAGWWKIDCPAGSISGVGGTENGSTGGKQDKGTTQTSPEWANWLASSQSYNNYIIDNPTPSAVDPSLLQGADEQLLNNSKTYISSSAFSKSENQNLESSAVQARSVFGPAYQDKVNNASVFIVGSQEYNNINEAQGLAAQENSEVSEQTAQNITQDLNKAIGHSDKDNVIIMNGEKVLIGKSGAYPENSTDILVHEYAHEVDRTGSTFQFSNSSEWQDIYNRSLKAEGVAFVSTYAIKDPQEDFAETVVFYNKYGGDPSKITSDPNDQQLIQERFDYLKKKGIVK